MHIRILFVLVVNFSFFFFSGCAGSPISKQNISDISTIKKSEKFNEVIFSGLRPQMELSEDYLIGPEDLLEIDAYQVEEVKKTVRVNSHGDIALPLVGVINVKGLTASEVEQLIASRLEKYVQDTVVTVFVKEYKSQRISVIGAVNKPNVFSVTGQRYLIDMLMMAEGISKDAGNICYIIRPVLKKSPGSTAETIVIDLDELLIKGNLALNIPVFAGDVINVPKGGIIFVDGSVRMPGPYVMRGRTTLVQAISMAQGVNPDAVLDDVRIFRDNGKGERDVIVADYDAIRNNKMPDIQLEENDIIIVPQSRTKNFFKEFVNTLKGFISFGSYPIF